MHDGHDSIKALDMSVMPSNLQQENRISYRLITQSTQPTFSDETTQMAIHTQTSTNTVPNRSTANENNGDVQALLNYYPRTAPPPTPVDFTKPGAEKKWEAHQSTRETVSLS